MEHLPSFPLAPCHPSVFSSPYWKTKKNLSGTCQGTNLESLESLNNIYPRPFHSVVWKEKKLTHKNSPPVKIGFPFYNSKFNMVPKKAGTIPEKEGVVLNKFYTGRLPPLALTPCSFIYHFSRKRFPFHIPCISKWYPFFSFTKFIRTFHPF